MNKHIQNPTESCSRYASDLATACINVLNYHSIKVDLDALINGLPILDGALETNQLKRAFSGIGYQHCWENGFPGGSWDYPCCAELLDGKFAVLLGVDQGNLMAVKPGDANSYINVPVADFNRLYSGRYFTVQPSLDNLLDKHSVSPDDRHWFWGVLMSEKLRLGDVIIASLFANVLAVMTSLFALQVYDRVIPSQSEATLWVLAIGVAVSIFFEALLRLSRAKLVDAVGKDTEVDISRVLFRRIVCMRLDGRSVKPASMVQIVREFSAVKEFFTTSSVGVVADLPFAFVFLVLIYFIAGQVAWLIAAGAILTVVPSLLMRSKMAKLSQENIGGVSAASRIVTEVSYGLETVKSARFGPFFQRQWEEVVSLNALKTTEQRSLVAFQTYWSTSMQQVTYVGAVIGGVYLIFAGELTMGSIVAVGILTTRTLAPVAQLAQVMTRWQNMRAAINSIDQIMHSQQDRDLTRVYFKRPKILGEYEIKNCKYIHAESQSPSLNIKSLKIEAGARMAVLGQNGSGKSTLLRLMSGLIDPSEGEVLIDGLDLRQLDPDDVRRNVGFLPQDVRLFQGTIRDNLSMSGSNFTDTEFFQALDFAGLSQYVKTRPEGLDLRIFDGGEGLSVGQRQSVGLARLFLQDPSIVLLDEPTSALDQNLEAQFVSRLGYWVASRTCIVATHRPQILEQMTHVAILRDGCLALYDEKDRVLKTLSAKNAGKNVAGEHGG